jgi:uncharacterized membrane protein YkoI
MKNFRGWLLIMLLALATQAMAAHLITKAQAEQAALNDVGGGTAIQAVRDHVGRTPIWSVDIRGTAHEYEVWVDAHTGVILKVITQPLASTSPMLSTTQAEAIATRAIGSGEVLQAELSQNADRKQWVVDINSTDAEHEVRLDAYSGAVLKITKQMKAATNCSFIPKAQAKAIALAAVNANKVLRIRLEKNDNPPVWSVDVRTAAGKEFEVKVDACTGQVVAIIPG